MAIMIILYLYYLNLVLQLLTLLTREVFYLIAQLFIDDTNFNIENIGKETMNEVIDRV